MTKLVLLLLFMCFSLFTPFSFSQNQSNAIKQQEVWVQDVIGVALRIRMAEQQYRKLSRDCALQSTGTEQTSETCKKAEEASATIKKARSEYQLILDKAASTSVPIDWLRAHFAWVRYGTEWDRAQNTNSP